MSRPPNRNPIRRRKPQPKVSILDRIIAAVPLSQAALRRIAAWSIVVLAGAGLIGVLSLFGLPGAVGTALAEEVGRAGFRVEQIDIAGLKRANRDEVLAAVLDQKSRAMPLVDLDAVRAKLMLSPWIADAHVSRHLPDALTIRIVERVPVAVWQHQGKLALVDTNGKVLAPVAADAMPDLPLVVGPGANLQQPGLARLMSAAPGLKGVVRAASWVGNRRWDLLFESGETLALPEGEAAAATALKKFADRDKVRPLLGRGWVRFDLRDPSRLVARKPGGSNRAITDPEAGSPGRNEERD